MLRGLGIIGEASKNLSRDLRVRYREVPWREIAGMRDKLTHGYFVNLELVWVTIKHKLPELKGKILKILKRWKKLNVKLENRKEPRVISSV